MKWKKIEGINHLQLERYEEIAIVKLVDIFAQSKLFIHLYIVYWLWLTHLVRQKVASDDFGVVQMSDYIVFNTKRFSACVFCGPRILYQHIPWPLCNERSIPPPRWYASGLPPPPLHMLLGFFPNACCSKARLFVTPSGMLNLTRTGHRTSLPRRCLRSGL